MVDLDALEAAAKAATEGELVSIPAGNKPEIWTDDGKVLVCRVESLRFVADAAYILAAQPRVVLELIAEVERLREAVSIAEAAFHDYMRLHLAKGTPDGDTKATRNAELANVMTAALAGDRHDD